MPKQTDQGPLTEGVYYILLALHTPMHGYGIMQFVKNISNNRVNLGPGTLYGAINNMLEKGWIQALETVGDSRKKEYVITDLGREITEIELERLLELVYNGQYTLRGEGK
ncbi:MULTISPECIES: PadR family transcriptional regulator [Bacillaceae]|uniref:PadR family transcriptional regulator n=1 Tax=Evansella alkalicola TaxID=745819 RepID=A0ABS6K054_9BACI|nr:MULTISPECIES: PadR family transcriptional regulator [Bacillaceae]MBU9724224.1 PadR family transcriptional regulator [Bacillus alkalicola]